MSSCRWNPLGFIQALLAIVVIIWAIVWLFQIGLWPRKSALSEDSSENGWTLVTGASSGIGLAFARELGRRGHGVLAVSRRGDRLEALVRTLALCPGAAKTENSVFSHNEGLFGKLPSLSADEIVRSAFRAFESGRAVRIVGWLNGMLGLLNHVLPRAVVRRMMGVSAKPPLQPSGLR